MEKSFKMQQISFLWLNSQFFKTGPLTTPTKLPNPTIVLSGDPDIDCFDLKLTGKWPFYHHFQPFFLPTLLTSFTEMTNQVQTVILRCFFSSLVQKSWPKLKKIKIKAWLTHQTLKLITGHFMTTSAIFFANYVNIFHKTEIQTVILRRGGEGHLGEFPWRENVVQTMHGRHDYTGNTNPGEGWTTRKTINLLRRRFPLDQLPPRFHHVQTVTGQSVLIVVGDEAKESTRMCIKDNVQWQLAGVGAHSRV